jgi:hypothetical protein
MSVSTSNFVRELTAGFIGVECQGVLHPARHPHVAFVPHAGSRPFAVALPFRRFHSVHYKTYDVLTYSIVPGSDLTSYHARCTSRMPIKTAMLFHWQASHLQLVAPGRD